MDKKQKQLESHKNSQRRYIIEQKKKDTGTLGIGKQLFKVRSPKCTTKTRNSLNSKREYNREMKRKEREKMSYQKKMWLRKKDKERKVEKRRLEVEQTLKSSSPDKEQETNFKTKKSEWNATCKVRSSLPTTPVKFAQVINNIITRTTPRKKKALQKVIYNKKVSKSFLKSLKSVSKKKLLLQNKAIRLRELRRSRKPVKRNQKKTRMTRISVQQIHSFYEHEDISRVLPQKKVCHKGWSRVCDASVH